MMAIAGRLCRLESGEMAGLMVVGGGLKCWGQMCREVGVVSRVKVGEKEDEKAVADVSHVCMVRDGG